MKKVILPGLIDPHVHLRDPQQTHKEDFYSGTSTALAGGYTTILDMPNNKIPITTNERLDEKIAIAKEKVVCDIGFYFGSLGNNIAEFSKVFDTVFGLKLYLNETTGNFLIDKKHIENIFTAWGSKPILLHAEDDTVSFIISLVAKTIKRVHFCHISTSFDLQQIMEAKEKNLPVTCGVTPHHLFLTEHDTNALGPFGKMKPPLRTKKDVAFLWKNLHAIDVIESDHAPHTKEEKENAIPPFGVPGLETTLPLLITAVAENRLSMNDVIRLCSQNPGRIFNIAEDKTTYIEIDTSKTYVIENKNLFTKSRWSPFAGWRVKGKVTQVVIRNTKVFADDKVLVSPGWGRVLG